MISAINADNGLLYKIFPPRRKWVHISEGKRKVTKVVAGVEKTKKLNQEKLNQLTCAVYKISKADGFDKEDLSTIQTIIEHIK